MTLVKYVAQPPKSYKKRRKLLRLVLLARQPHHRIYPAPPKALLRFSVQALPKKESVANA